ncbi:MAG TPA: divalent-cation tolerance protein CutA [bacterium]|nr:divalent-cation tolerance protein CutA [bacterium]
MPKCVVCLTTVAKRKDAERIARHLVAGKFAACVNVIPGIVSHYRWKGKVCRAAELLLVMKTAAFKAKQLEMQIQAIHPYDLPEFVVLPIVGGSPRYLKWILES